MNSSIDADVLEYGTVIANGRSQADWKLFICTTFEWMIK